ncbi:ABC transporter substrate-binding protein [Streptomyces sp. CLV115]|uniref:ABC transporter substrate-binding protein n=1 Tax=Streptomyces sp. CLV115 TaxID=3138502 RepID=UPI00313CB915
MYSRGRMRRRLGAAALAVSATGALVGCGTAAGPSKAAGDASAPLHHLLPGSVARAGRLVVATNATYPPIEYFAKDNRTIIGFDPDLGAALGRKLGIEFKFVNVTKFDAVIPGLVADRYDIAMTYMSDFKDRYDKVHFVNYYEDKTVLVTTAANPAGVDSFDDLCGRTVAVQTGSFAEINTAEAQSKACVARGDAVVGIVQLPAATDKQTQLQSGRADAAITALPNASHLVAQNPDKFTIVGKPITAEGAYVGIAVPAAEVQLRDALQAAMQALLDSGEYRKLVERYGLEAGAVKKALINRDGAGS